MFGLDILLLQHLAANFCFGDRIWLYFEGLWRHSCVSFRAVFRTCIYTMFAHMHLLIMICTVHNTVSWLQNNENDSHSHPQNEPGYFIITTGLYVHAPYHQMPIKDTPKLFEELLWSSKKRRCIMEKAHALAPTTHHLCAPAQMSQHLPLHFCPEKMEEMQPKLSDYSEHWTKSIRGTCGAETQSALNRY